MKTRATMYVSAVNGTYSLGTAQNRYMIHCNAVYSPDPTHPNYVFWKATPSGTLRLSRNGEDHGFVPGQKYHIDLEPSESGTLALASHEVFDTCHTVHLQSPVSYVNGEGVTVYGQEWARLEMQITNPDAWPIFENTSFNLTITRTE